MQIKSVNWLYDYVTCTSSDIVLVWNIILFRNEDILKLWISYPSEMYIHWKNNQPLHVIKRVLFWRNLLTLVDEILIIWVMTREKLARELIVQVANKGLDNLAHVRSLNRIFPVRRYILYWSDACFSADVKFFFYIYIYIYRERERDRINQWWTKMWTLLWQILTRIKLLWQQWWENLSRHRTV